MIPLFMQIIVASYVDHGMVVECGLLELGMILAIQYPNFHKPHVL